MAKHRFLRIICSLLAAVCAITLMCSCNKQKSEEITDVPKTEDNYRTYYQIFPYSFADSNGDGIGDINGIIQKLDYIDNMNFDGIWLTPVHKSTTYHKYDVVDYKSIDSQFGTMADYDKLVEECHKRGMTVLLDLVFNHTSDKHEWFDSCYAAHERNRPQDQYYNYYNFERKSSSKPSGWEDYDSKWMYECQFWSGMPDLNLQNVLDEPDGYLANDLKEIMRFWLEDHNVDGFRLDAVTSYFTGNNTKNKEFLTWLNKTAKSIKKDCYIVGEGAWGNVAENRTYQESGVDSFFAFQHGYSGNGTLSYCVRLEKAFYLSDIDAGNKRDVAGGIPALFVANHDTPRAWGILQGSSDVNNIKMGYGLMAMCCGSTFWYYGDELGMNVYKNPSAKDFRDEDRRQPMPFDDEYRCKPVAGSSAADDSEKYKLGTVDKNVKDSGSVLNYIKRANALRRAYPQIARSYAESVYLSDDGTVAVIKKGSGDDTIYIVMNVSHEQTANLDLSDIVPGLKLAATLSVDAQPSISGNKLKMPKQTFAILKG